MQMVIFLICEKTIKSFYFRRVSAFSFALFDCSSTRLRVTKLYGLNEISKCRQTTIRITFYTDNFCIINEGIRMSEIGAGEEGGKKKRHIVQRMPCS